MPNEGNDLIPKTRSNPRLRGENRHEAHAVRAASRRAHPRASPSLGPMSVTSEQSGRTYQASRERIWCCPGSVPKWMLRREVLVGITILSTTQYDFVPGQSGVQDPPNSAA